MTDVDELRTRLGVGAEHTTDDILQACLDVAAAMVDPHVPEAARVDPLYHEAQQTLAVRVYEERVRGRVGVDAAGDLDLSYTPGPTAGMVLSVWGYIGPLTATGGAVVA